RMNDVRVVLRDGFAIFPDLIEMFGRASVVWTSPSVGAEVVAGEARLVIDLLLVDYWDDERAARGAREQEQAPEPKSLIDDVLQKLEAKAAAHPVESVEISPDVIAALSSEED